MIKRHNRRAFLTACFFPAVLNAQEDFAIITQPGNSHSVGRSQLKKIMLGQEAHWPGGGKILLLLGPSGDPSRIAALKRLAGMSESDFYKNVMHLNFTGQGDLAPLTLPSIATLVQQVKTRPGSVGIVPVSAVNPSVKRIEVE